MVCCYYTLVNIQTTIVSTRLSPLELGFNVVDDRQSVPIDTNREPLFLPHLICNVDSDCQSFIQLDNQRRRYKASADQNRTTLI